MAGNRKICPSSGNTNLTTDHSWHRKCTGSQMILFILNPATKEKKQQLRYLIYKRWKIGICWNLSAFLKKQTKYFNQSSRDMHFPTLLFSSSSPNLHIAYLKNLKCQDPQIYKCWRRRAGKPAGNNDPDSKLTNRCCLTIQSGYWALSKWMNETDSRMSKRGTQQHFAWKAAERVGIQPMMHPRWKWTLLNTELFSGEKTGNCKENRRASLPS